MTTKELIKLLQEADPKGNTHVRIANFGEDPSGIPDYVCKLAGYWDGSYEYIDKDGNLVFTTADSKVDINVLCYDNWIEQHIDDWEDKLKFNYTYSDKEGNKKRADAVIKRFKKLELEYRSIEQEIKNQFIVKTLKDLKDGWKLVERISAGYTVLERRKGLKKEPIGNGYSNMIMNCGFFKKKGKEWILEL